MLAIITIVTGIVLVSQNTFNRTLVLANAAYDVSLTLRSAETYGLGSRGAGSTANAGYGVDFSMGAPTALSFFADTVPAPGASGACHALPSGGASAPNALPGNCRYDGLTSGELVQTYALGNGVHVSRFCAYSGLTSYCTSGGSRAIDTLDIVFARPNPTPTFSVSKSGVSLAVGGGTSSLYKSCVTLSSPQGDTRSVTTWWDGAIIESNGNCP